MSIHDCIDLDLLLFHHRVILEAFQTDSVETFVKTGNRHPFESKKGIQTSLNDVCAHSSKSFLWQIVSL